MELVELVKDDAEPQSISDTIICCSELVLFYDHTPCTEQWSVFSMMSCSSTPCWNNLVGCSGTQRMVTPVTNYSSLLT